MRAALALQELIKILAITHELHSSIDENYELGEVFLDISKSFDKAWYKGITHKLQPNGISENLFNLLANFLKSQKQRIVLDVQLSSWANVIAGVRQCSILVPLFPLIHINDVSSIFNVIQSVSLMTRPLLAVRKSETTNNNLNPFLANVPALYSLKTPEN